MEIVTIGLDLAKNVLQVHGVNERGKAVLRKQLKRDQVGPFFANLSPCLIGIEACASAHHRARKLQALGHTVRLMAPQFVKPYVKSNKNDAAVAEATRSSASDDGVGRYSLTDTAAMRPCWTRAFTRAASGPCAQLMRAGTSKS